MKMSTDFIALFAVNFANLEVART